MMICGRFSKNKQADLVISVKTANDDDNTFA